MISYQKLFSYLVIVFSTSIVVFNNTTDLANKLFKPTFNFYYFLSWGFIILGTIGYVTYNWQGKK